MDVPYIQLNFVYETLKDMTAVHYKKSMEECIDRVSTRVTQLKGKYDLYRRNGRKENEGQSDAPVGTKKAATTTATTIVPPRTNPVVEVKAEATDGSSASRVIPRTSSTVTVSDDEPNNTIAAPQKSSSAPEAMVLETPDKDHDLSASSSVLLISNNTPVDSSANRTSSAPNATPSSTAQLNNSLFAASVEVARSGSNPRIPSIDGTFSIEPAPDGNALVMVPLPNPVANPTPTSVSYPLGTGKSAPRPPNGRPNYLAPSNPTPARPTPPMQQPLPVQEQQLPVQQQQVFVHPQQQQQVAPLPVTSYVMGTNQMPLGVSQSLPITNQQLLQQQMLQQRQLQMQHMHQAPLMAVAPQNQRQLVNMQNRQMNNNEFAMYQQHALMQQQQQQLRQIQQQQQQPAQPRHISSLCQPVMKITGSTKTTPNSISIQFTVDDAAFPNRDQSVQTIFDKETLFRIYERTSDGNIQSVTEYRTQSPVPVPANLELQLEATDAPKLYAISAVCPGTGREIRGRFETIR